LWTLIGFNLNGLATLWIRDHPELRYDVKQTTDVAREGILGWETFHASTGMKQYCLKMPNTIELSTNSFSVLCEELTGSEFHLEREVSPEAAQEDEAALRLNAEGGELDLTVESPVPVEETPGTSSGYKARAPYVPFPFGERPRNQFDETAKGVDSPRKFQRQRDEKAQDNMLVYAALACAAGAGVIYYA
jgi:hypothetical protein